MTPSPWWKSGLPWRDSRSSISAVALGHFAQAFRRAGAASVFVEPFWESMGDSGRQLGYGVIGDGVRLPFAEGAFDISHSSNVLEHVTDPAAFVDEMVRVVRPGGLGVPGLHQLVLAIRWA